MEAQGASPVAQMCSRDRFIQMRALTDPARESFWESCQAPPWATDWGSDDYGAWVEFSIEDKGSERVIQRMRWIEPGSFQMGSPEDEPERDASEGPRHEVRIAEGFWLFDTACTQALWEAVMGDIPARFEGAQRPVEQVSWFDVQQFITTLNARVPGLGLSLPSEAQWEYACRAGTETALYSGPIKILGDANAPALDAIAWYGGNSSVGFELENGQERTWLREMQYPEGKAGTHPVKGKLPNPWGLYDILGNVFEWVEDAWQGSYEGAPADGSAWGSADTGADRVIRGGSWSDYARDCRSAYRNLRHPDFRSSVLGFRCARVQV